MCGRGALLLLDVSLPQISGWCPSSPKLASFLALASPLKKWSAYRAYELRLPDLGMPPLSTKIARGNSFNTVPPNTDHP